MNEEQRGRAEQLAAALLEVVTADKAPKKGECGLCGTTAGWYGDKVKRQGRYGNYGGACFRRVDSHFINGHEFLLCTDCIQSYQLRLAHNPSLRHLYRDFENVPKLFVAKWLADRLMKLARKRSEEQ